MVLTFDTLFSFYFYSIGMLNISIFYQDFKGYDCMNLLDSSHILYN